MQYWLGFKLKYWWIIQSLEAYNQHPNLIGCGLKEKTDRPIHSKFQEIKKGDFIVYYATGDKVLVGIFEVTSDMSYLRDDEYWGESAVYELKPTITPTDGSFIDWKKVLFDQTLSFDLFADKENWTFKIWKHYIHPLSIKDFETIKKAILSKKYETASAVEEKTISDRLGPAFGTIDLLFEPVDEMGVVYLFAKHHRELGFPFIVKMRRKYPDVIAIDNKGEKAQIELEYRSSGFNHDSKGCEYIVCWIDDLEENMKKNLPKIIDLKKQLSNIYSKINIQQ